MNDDLISRSWILEQLDGLGDTRLIKRNFVALVTNAPTVDAVPVVICRDCKHRDGVPGQPNIDCFQMHDDDFCSYGERKDGVWKEMSAE